MMVYNSHCSDQRSRVNEYKRMGGEASESQSSAVEDRDERCSLDLSLNGVLQQQNTSAIHIPICFQFSMDT